MYSDKLVESVYVFKVKQRANSSKSMIVNVIYQVYLSNRDKQKKFLAYLNFCFYPALPRHPSIIFSPMFNIIDDALTLFLQNHLYYITWISKHIFSTTFQSNPNNLTLFRAKPLSP